MTGGRITIGKPLLECVPELADQPVIKKLDEVYRTGRSKTVREFPARLLREVVLQDCWFDVTWQPMRDFAGNVNGVLVSAVEVTTHVRARRSIEAAHASAENARRLTEAITSNATLGLVMTDGRQHCTFMNPAAEEIFGYKFDEVQGLNRPLHQIVHHTRPNASPYPM